MEAGGGGLGFHAAASLAYSQDKSSQAASDTQSTREGSLTVTSASCFTSTMQMRNYNFHPSFIAELIAASEDQDKMLALVKKYGTLYYASASITYFLIILGGLTLISTRTWW